MSVIDRFATIFCSKKDTIAKVIIHCVAVEAGTVALVGAQVPGDRFLIGAMQIDMVLRLAKVYEKRLDRAGAAAIVKASVATAVAPEAVNQIVKYVPGYGNITNLGVASSVTEGIGWIAIKMFKDGSWFNKSKEN